MPTLEFKGKQYIYSHHHSVPFRELLVDNKQSLPATGKKPSLDDNLIIHGDNLHALKALMPQYAGKIKCIYIDPPYNTGNEGWCYNDNVNSPLMKEWIQKNANPVDKEDMQRHDKWLCMMYPRLKLLHELLADDGVIFVSIDDNEVHHLRAVMDEIFNDCNFVTEFIWRSRLGKGATSTNVALLHEYVLCYSKNINYLDFRKDERISKDDSKERLRQWGQGDKREDRPSMYYPLIAPNGEEVYPVKPDGTDGRWRIGEESAKKLNDSGLISFEARDDGRYEAYRIIKSGNVTSTAVDSLLMDNEVTTTAHGSKQLKEVFGGVQPFDYPKPSALVRYLINLHLDKNSIILDSFAGSGTTAHAVLDLNKEDGGNRKFILVEMEDYAGNITAERVRRVIKGVPTAKDEKLKAGLGGSFAFCELGKEISIEKLLTGEALPDYSALANYVFYTATGKSLEAQAKEKPDYFVGETDLYEIYLIYKPDISFLRSNDSALNDLKLKAIAARKSKKEKLVFATAKYMGQKELSEQNITFCQLPYAIHKVVGS